MIKFSHNVCVPFILYDVGSSSSSSNFCHYCDTHRATQHCQLIITKFSSQLQYWQRGRSCTGATTSRTCRGAEWRSCQTLCRGVGEQTQTLYYALGNNVQHGATILRQISDFILNKYSRLVESNPV